MINPSEIEIYRIDMNSIGMVDFSVGINALKRLRFALCQILLYSSMVVFSVILAFGSILHPASESRRFLQCILNSPTLTSIKSSYLRNELAACKCNNK